MLSKMEKKILTQAYNHYLETGSREFTYVISNSNEYPALEDTFYDLVKKGYISNLDVQLFQGSFNIEDKAIHDMKLQET